MAAAMALPLMQTASIAFGFATNSRNVFKMIKEVTESPHHKAHNDLVELSLLLMSIQQPFLIATQLQTREETIEQVDAAVVYAKRVLRKCAVFLESRQDIIEKIEDAEDDENEAPNPNPSPNPNLGSDHVGDDYAFDAKVMDKWLTKDRQSHMKSLCASLSNAAGVLGLAISTTTLLHGRFDPAAELGQAEDEASRKAQALLFEFESGRVETSRIGSGEYFTFMETPVKRQAGAKSKDLVGRGFATICLMKGKTGYALEARFQDTDVDDLSIPLTKTVTCVLIRKGEIDDGVLCNRAMDRHDICLEINQSQRKAYVVLDVVDGISAQTFVAIIHTARDSINGDVKAISSAVKKINLATPTR